MTKCDTGAGLTIFDFFTNMPFEWPLMVYLSMGVEGRRRVGLVPQHSGKLCM